MIPKKIHYCWFGKNEIPQKLKKCIDSWYKYCPDYEVILWNEDNYDINKIDFIKDAYDDGNYAFVSDYARLDIIYNNGGIYLDTDVELIKSLDSLLNNVCFFGCEHFYNVNTGLCFGSLKYNEFIKENMSIYENSDYFSIRKTCVEITTDLLIKRGLRYRKGIQKIADITIYPKEYFNPMNIKNEKIKITENTYSIHRYSASWKSKKILPDYIKVYARYYIDSIFGYGFYRKFLRKIKLMK